MSPARNIWAVVPVKAFNAAKQRLASVYPPNFRRELARLMLEDVLATISQVSRLSGLMVVTCDPEARRLVTRYGARVIEDGATAGYTASISAAARLLAQEGRDGMLALPGDVPGITAHEVGRLLAAHQPGRSLTIVPAHDGDGSNALLLTPPDAISPAYGEDSFRRHLEIAGQAGIHPVIVRLPGIGLDLDRPADVAAFARQPSLTRTWDFLRSTSGRHGCSSRPRAPFMAESLP